MCRALVMIVAVLCGCGDEQLERIEAIKEEVCACKTPECGEAAMQKVPANTIESTRKTQRVAREMMDCLKKLYDKERPVTDPDAELPDEPEDTGSAAPAK